MKPNHLKVARVAAVLSSATLLGLYVSCRGRERASPAVVADPAPQPAEQPPQVVPEHEREVFVGTKSAAVFPAPKQEERPVMPGSKSPFPLLPRESEPAKQPDPRAPAQTQSPK